MQNYCPSMVYFCKGKGVNHASKGRRYIFTKNKECRSVKTNVPKQQNSSGKRSLDSSHLYSLSLFTIIKIISSSFSLLSA